MNLKNLTQKRNNLLALGLAIGFALLAGLVMSLSPGSALAQVEQDESVSSPGAMVQTYLPLVSSKRNRTGFPASSDSSSWSFQTIGRSVLSARTGRQSLRV